MRVPPPPHPVATGAAARVLPLPLAELERLSRSIAETAGAEAADEVLFGLGQRLGESVALELRATGSDRHTALRDGLTRVTDMGLGETRLDTLELDAATGHCRVVGRVLDTMQLLRREGERSGAVCEVTVGYLTGLTAAVTGIDVVCSSFHCGGVCEQCECTFEIRPGARRRSAIGGPAPSGSARFFLASMGRSLAETDIGLDALVENNSDAIILIDAHDVIRFWSRGAERLFLYTREEAVGRDIRFLLPADLLDPDELVWIRQELAREGALRNHVTRRLRKDGVELWVSSSRAVLHDSQGKPVGSTATIRDITEQRRTEEELSRSRSLAMVGELAAQIAHEIKNPLAGIYAAVQLLGRDLDPVDSRKEILDSIGGEIRRLDDIVQDLLRFARPQQPRPRPTDLRTFVAELLESMHHNPDLQRHAVSLDIPEGLIVAADGRLFAEVFGNLVLNAAQAMEQPGRITITAESAGQRITVEVGDTGPGIPEDKLLSIFEPFVTTKARGTGLGLPIARRDVEAHGGTLRVENRTDGGAVFRIELPAATD